jgi:hypothetical protein
MAQEQDPVTRPNGGSGRSQQIEADIDRTRAAMDRTVDAIAGKLTPQQLMMEALGVFKDGSSALAAKVVQTAREHPVPATIIGIGIGLLLTESAKAGSSGGTSTTDFDTRNRNVGFGGYGDHAAGEPDVRTDGFTNAVKDKTAEVKDTVAYGAMEAREKVGEKAAQVKQQASHVKEQVKAQAGQLKEQVTETTEHVREKAANVPVYARQQWHDAQLGFWQTMDQKPFAIGMAALAAGVAAGLTVPATRKENELMGEARDRLLDQAKGLGRDAVDKGRQVARAATDVVKTEVDRQGLRPAAIAEKVRTIGREAEQALKAEAERVVPETLKATGTSLPGQGSSSPGGAAGRGMSAGFASTSDAPMGSADSDSTIPLSPGKKIRE